MSNNDTVKNNKCDTYQLKKWIGKFGDDYIERNPYEEWKIDLGKEGFRRIIKNREVESILEVGSNIGLNLIYLSAVIEKKVDLFAVEPNRKAFSILTSNNKIRLKKAWNVSAFELPMEDSSIDLVFNSGVLIHISPDDLGFATDEIVRVAKKYVLCIEYFSHKPEAILYQGQNNLLFKRDFGSFYLDRYPNLKCIDYGFLWKRELKIFDNLTWWLFSKKC